MYKYSLEQISTNNNTNNDNSISFDFDSKLTCKLIFTDITELVYDYLSTSDRSKSRSIGSFFNIERRKAIKTYFNDFFPKWLLNKADFIAAYDRIIWRYQINNIIFNEDDDEEGEEDNLSLGSEAVISLTNCDIEINRTNSNCNISTGHCITNRNLPCFGRMIKLRGKSFQNDLKSPKNQSNQKYKKEY